MKYEIVKELDKEEFRRLTGVKRSTFNKMVGILCEENKKKKAKGGRKNKLNEENMLLMVLEYLREYRTYFHISQSYGVSESTAYKTVKWVEDTLIQHPDFALPGRKELLKSDVEYEILVIDATETPVERPKKAEKILFRKEEKTYTKNTNNCRKEEQENYLYVISNGRKHDFRLFKESKVHVSEGIKVLADAGYRGFQKIHKNVELPHRRMKKSPLIKEKKVENRELASKRVVVENVIGLLKRFKIIADRYRNRRKRFGLRFNLIAGIHNFELSI